MNCAHCASGPVWLVHSTHVPAGGAAGTVLDQRRVNLLADLGIDAGRHLARRHLERSEHADFLVRRQRGSLHQADQLLEHRPQLGLRLRLGRGVRDGHEPLGQRHQVRFRHHQLHPLGARRVFERDATRIAHESIGTPEQRVDVGHRREGSATRRSRP